jgi:hypothetical protein
MQSAEIRSRRPHPAVRQRRHGAVQAVLPGPAARRRTRARRACRSACAPSTSTRSARPPARTVLPDVRQLLLRRLLQGRAIQLAWELLTTPSRTGGYGLRPGPAVGDGLPRRRRGRDIWAADRRRPAGAHPAPRHGRQLLVDGRPRPVRAVLGDLLRPRPELRRRGRPGRRRGPLPRDLEPRLHAVRARPRAGPRTTSRSWASCRPRTSTPAWAWSAWPAVLQGVDNIYEIDTSRRSSTARPS